MSNCSWGEWRYIFLRMGVVSAGTGISWTSPKRRSGRRRLGSSPGNTSRYSLGNERKSLRMVPSHPSKCGTAPSGKSFSPNNTSYTKVLGDPLFFNMSTYSKWGRWMLPSGISNCTNNHDSGNISYTRFKSPARRKTMVTPIMTILGVLINLVKHDKSSHSTVVRTSNEPRCCTSTGDDRQQKWVRWYIRAKGSRPVTSFK